MGEKCIKQAMIVFVLTLASYDRTLLVPKYFKDNILSWSLSPLKNKGEYRMIRIQPKKQEKNT